MIDSAQQVSALSFTRQLGGSETTESARSEMAPSLSTPAEPTPGNPDFGTTLAGIGNDMVGSLREAERAAMAGILGKADTREVVDAVMTAEQTLRTAIAIRDKIVQSYLEISRMQI